jgi:hypothetical protein
MEKRLFGEANYQFYIGTSKGLLGFQQINDPAKYPSTKGFPTTRTSTGVLLQPPYLLTERRRAPLYTALTRAQIHTNALDICDKRQVPRTGGALCDILLVALM